MGKLLALVAVVLGFVLLFKPRLVPWVLRRLGRSVHDVGQVGRELSSGEEEPGSALARYEVQAGELVLLKVNARVSPSTDPQLQEEVQTLGERLAAAARRQEIPYRFVAIDDEEPQAFAVPGGSVFVSRGLIELCAGSRDALAGVLGHEVAHIDLRHAILQLAARAAAKGGARLLTLGRTVLLGRLAGQIEELLVQGYSRESELEADRRGAELALGAGFDPRGLARLLRRLAARDPGPEPRWKVFRYFSSHPPVEERIRRLEARYGAASR